MFFRLDFGQCGPAEVGDDGAQRLLVRSLSHLGWSDRWPGCPGIRVKITFVMYFLWFSCFELSGRHIARP